jgi:hypothetical protein
MYKVTWKFYGKYHKEKTFATYKEAKGFFYGYCVKTRGITSAKLTVL